MSMICNYLIVDKQTIENVKNGKMQITSVLDDNIDDDIYINIDKAWHGIHFLLCNDVWGGDIPLFNVVLGGKEINDEDVGYGPARYLDIEDVIITYNAIVNIKENELKEKYSRQLMVKNEIYAMSGDPKDNDFQYLWSYFVDIVNHFKKAMERKKCIIIYLN